MPDPFTGRYALIEQIQAHREKRDNKSKYYVYVKRCLELKSQTIKIP